MCSHVNDSDVSSAQLCSQFDASVDISYNESVVTKPITKCGNKLPNESYESCSTTWSDDTIGSTAPTRSQYRVIFEIISAKTVSRGSNSSGHKKYVSYAILVKRVPGLETHPGIIERRYSDFLILYQSLKKRFPPLLTDFPFPKKLIVGNFTPELITQRSVAFQHLLAYCLSIRELRITPEFAEFLYNRELKEAQRLLKNAQFEDVSNIIENVYYIQEKLMLHSGESSIQLFNTLCVLIACLNAVDNTDEAQKFAKKAIELISACNSYDNSELVVPLIILSIKLRWICGQQKAVMEDKLQQYKQKRGVKVNIEKEPTLLQHILTKDFLIASNI